MSFSILSMNWRGLENAIEQASSVGYPIPEDDKKLIMDMWRQHPAFHGRTLRETFNYYMLKDPYGFRQLAKDLPVLKEKMRKWAELKQRSEALSEQRNLLSVEMECLEGRMKIISARLSESQQEQSEAWTELCNYEYGLTKKYENPFSEN